MSPPTAAARRGGPPLVLALLALGGILLGAAMIAAQALGLGVGTGGPAATAPVTGAAAERTLERVTGALSAAGLQVQEPQVVFRPGESPGLIGVPRRVLQVIVPDDRTHGHVVVYELPDNIAAEEAGRDLLGYLAGGTGAIQYPRDAQFVVRRVGRTLVFYPWSPEASPDPMIARAAAVLAGLGEPIRGG